MLIYYNYWSKWSSTQIKGGYWWNTSPTSGISRFNAEYEEVVVRVKEFKRIETAYINELKRLKIENLDIGPNELAQKLIKQSTSSRNKILAAAIEYEKIGLLIENDISALGKNIDVVENNSGRATPISDEIWGSRPGKITELLGGNSLRSRMKTASGSKKSPIELEMAKYQKITTRPSYDELVRRGIIKTDEVSVDTAKQLKQALELPNVKQEYSFNFKKAGVATVLAASAALLIYGGYQTYNNQLNLTQCN